MEVVKEVNETSQDMAEEFSKNSWRTWYSKLPVKPIDILNIILLMGFLQSWFFVYVAEKFELGWNIFFTQDLVTILMVFVSAQYFAANKLEKRNYNWPLFILVGYMIISNTWSYSPNMGGTIQLAVFLMYAVYLKNRYNTKQFLYLFNGFMAIVAILSFLHVETFPETYSYIYMGRESWMGMFGNKNTLGMAMAIAIVTNLMVILNYKQKNYNKIILITLCLFEGYLLYKSYSVTSWLAAFAIVLIIVKHHFFPIKRYGIYFICAISLGLLIVFGHQVVGQFVSILTPRDMTFSGRTPVWDACKEYFYENPWLGYGYNGIWSKPELLETVLQKTGVALTETHNGIFDILLQFGIVGFTVFSLGFYKFVKNIKVNKESFVLFSLVLSLLFIGYGESIPISFNTPYLILFFYCIL